MPRIPRGQVGGHAYHVLNRGNGGATVFHKDGDYSAFLNLLVEARAKFPVKVFSVCLILIPCGRVYRGVRCAERWGVEAKNEPARPELKNGIDLYLSTCPLFLFLAVY